MIAPILIWNIRGVGNSGSRRCLKEVVVSNKVEIVAISEPKVDIIKAPALGRYIKLGGFASCSSPFPKIWVFWQSSHNLEVIASSPQFITLGLKIDNSYRAYYSFVYASNDFIQRQVLFSDLLVFAGSVSIPWVIGGDFNCVLRPSEKKGGSMPSLSVMADFGNFLVAAGLVDAGCTGNEMTWSNNRVGKANICARLDRVLVNNFCLAAFPQLFVKHLPRGPSDHSPLLLLLDNLPPRAGRFIFQKMWTTHDSFLGLVSETWNQCQVFDPNPLASFSSKLKLVKFALCKWNKEVFGDIHQSVLSAKLHMEQMQMAYDLDPSQANKDNSNAATAVFRQVLYREEIFWYQKSRADWIASGDRNTAFYHAVTQQNRRRSYIRKLRVGNSNDWSSDQEDLRNHAVAYFKQLFTSEDHCVDIGMMQYIPQLITQEQNSALCSIPSSVEIKDAVWSLKSTSAPGPDGFSGVFFITAWDIIEQDFCAAVKAFFQGYPLPRCLTSSLITLIPKILKPTSFNDFRPISLCNFTYKVISKILSERLAPLLPTIISQEQGAFVKGRFILDNVFLVKQMMQDIDRKVRGHNLVLKLDMAKAYDRMEWDFILAVLRKFGFCSRFTSLIGMLLHNCWFSVSFNGVAAGFFKSSRGIRQGDPIAPYLFVIASEVLSRGLSASFQAGRLKGYAGPRGVLQISHLLYADDTVVFLNASKRNIENFQQFIGQYESCSGQKVNPAKSSFLLSNKAPRLLRQTVFNCTGYHSQGNCIKYLGIPIKRGRYCCSDFGFLIDRFQAKLAGWQSKLLSQAGRVILISSVLQSMPVYLASACFIPKRIIKFLDSLCASFFWKGNNDTSRRHWIAWSSIQKPCVEGGLGIRELLSVQIAFVVKMLWNILHGSSLWALYARLRFIKTHIADCNKTFPAGIPSVIFRQARDILLEHSRWFLGSGDKVDFLRDNWTGNGPLFSAAEDRSGNDIRRVPVSVISDVMRDGHHLAWSFIGTTHPPILNILAEDRCFWGRTANGDFSLKSAYNLIRNKGVRRSPWTKLWHSSLSPRVALFIWKLLHRAIPVDSRVIDCGIHLASRCVCCSSPMFEDLNHVFIHGDLAATLWNWLLPITSNNVWFGNQITHRCWNLLSNTKTTSAFSFIGMLLVFSMLWEVWKHRCALKYEGVSFSSQLIKRNIILNVQSVLDRIKFDSSISSQQFNCLQYFGLAPCIQVKQPLLVYCRLASFGFSLHIDGASKGNPGNCGGGGCIRNQAGVFVCGFAFNYGFGKSLVAECRALHDGLAIAKFGGIKLQAIFSDCRILVDACRKGILPSWSVIPWWSETLSLFKESEGELHHIHREGNQVADSLASYACNALINMFFSTASELPSLAKGALKVDKAGLPAFRF